MASLAEALQAIPPSERDRYVDALLGLTEVPEVPAPGPELIGYHPSGVLAVEQLIREVPIAAADHFVDLGSGLGKVTLLVRLLTGARVTGVEIDPALHSSAVRRASALQVEVEYLLADARLHVPDADVYFLYLPFLGSALEQVMGHLEQIARGHPIRIGTLGLDLERFPFLEPLPSSDFWTSIYRSR